MSNPSAGLSRGSLEEVCADEPELLFSIRRIAIARRRDLGEDIFDDHDQYDQYEQENDLPPPAYQPHVAEFQPEPIAHEED